MRGSGDTAGSPLCFRRRCVSFIISCIKHLYSILLAKKEKEKRCFTAKEFENQVVSHFTAEVQRGPACNKLPQRSVPALLHQLTDFMPFSSFKTGNHMHNFHLRRSLKIKSPGPHFESRASESRVPGICISKQANCPCLSWGFLSTYAPPQHSLRLLPCYQGPRTLPALHWPLLDLDFPPLPLPLPYRPLLR